MRGERDDIQSAMANEDIVLDEGAVQIQAAAADMRLGQDRQVARNRAQEKRKDAFVDEVGGVSGFAEVLERSNLAKVVEKSEAASPVSELEEKPVLAGGAEALKARSDTVPRAFTKKDGVWYESGYEGSKAVDLRRDSKLLQGLIEKDGDIARFLEWEEAVVFRVGATWYRLSQVEG